MTIMGKATRPLCLDTAVLLAALLVLGVSASGCAPTTAKDCAVLGVRGHEVEVTAKVKNLSTKTLSSVVALLETPHSLVGYTFHGPIEPWKDRQMTEWQLVAPDTGAPNQRLGAVSRCTVYQIKYSDGSSWQGPSPM